MYLIYWRDRKPRGLVKIQEGRAFVVEGSVPEEDLYGIPIGKSIVAWVHSYGNVMRCNEGRPYFSLLAEYPPEEFKEVEP